MSREPLPEFTLDQIDALLAAGAAKDEERLSAPKRGKLDEIEAAMWRRSAQAAEEPRDDSHSGIQGVA